MDIYRMDHFLNVHIHIEHLSTFAGPIFSMVWF